jgi:hypothetical protein
MDETADPISAPEPTHVRRPGWRRGPLLFARRPQVERSARPMGAAMFHVLDEPCFECRQLKMSSRSRHSRRTCQ